MELAAELGREGASELEGEREGEGGITTVFASPSTLMEASILMVMGASWASRPSSVPSSKAPKVSSLMGTAGAFEVYGGGAEPPEVFWRLAANSASLRLWWLMESDGGSMISCSED